MKKVLLAVIVIVFILLGAYLWVEPALSPSTDKVGVPLYSQPIVTRSEEIIIKVSPDKIFQGDPAIIVIEGSTSVQSIKFDGKELKPFDYEGKPTALFSIDLRARAGTYPIEVTLVNGEKIKKDLAVGARTVVKAPLGIPEKLGGDTPEAEKELLNTLAQESVLISSIVSGDKKLWEGDFRLPLAGPITITDVYGYSRITGASTIAHKGTDYRAAVGTPVYAINSGKVAFTSYLRNYGHTVIVDHGAGVLSIYMHLSEILVKKGDVVNKGHLVAKSGDTGYVLGPHLHLTIRINSISIDPQKFMSLLGGN